MIFLLCTFSGGPITTNKLNGSFLLGRFLKYDYFVSIYKNVPCIKIYVLFFLIVHAVTFFIGQNKYNLFMNICLMFFFP